MEMVNLVSAGMGACVDSPLTVAGLQDFYALWQMMVVNSSFLAIFGIAQLASRYNRYVLDDSSAICAFRQLRLSESLRGIFHAHALSVRSTSSPRTLAHEEPHLNGSTLLWLVCSILNLAAATLSFSRRRRSFRGQ